MPSSDWKQISFLRVVVPPEIETIDAPNDVMIPEGNSVKLSCKARGKMILKSN